MATKRTPLTTKDLLTADSEGFGYLGHSCRRPEAWASLPDPHDCAKALDEAVVAAANELGWTAAQLAAWANSKAGRWFGDDLNTREMGQVVAAKAQALRAMRKHPA